MSTKVVKVSLFLPDPNGADRTLYASVVDQAGEKLATLGATAPLLSRMGKATEKYFLARIGNGAVDLTDIVPDQSW